MGAATEFAFLHAGACRSGALTKNFPVNVLTVIPGTSAAGLDTSKTFSFAPPELIVIVTAPPLCALLCVRVDRLHVKL